MAKIKAIALNEDERAALEKGSKHSLSPAFRQHCQMILLKSQWRSSQEVARQVGCCEVVVNAWLARYQEHRLDGLKTRPGRGRRPILKAETDLQAVRRAVQKNRQRVSLAKAQLQEELGKEFSMLTLKRFLKNKRFLKKRWPLQASAKASETHAECGCLRVQA